MTDGWPTGGVDAWAVFMGGCQFAGRMLGLNLWGFASLLAACLGCICGGGIQFAGRMLGLYLWGVASLFAAYLGCIYGGFPVCLLHAWAVFMGDCQFAGRMLELYL